MSGNMLTGAPGPGAPMAPGLAPAGPPPGGPPPGQQMTAAIAQHLTTLPPDKLSKAAANADYLVHVFGTLARMPNLTIKDVISMAGQSVADGKATPAEASAEVSGLPKDPAQLKAMIQQRLHAEIITASLLSGSPQGGAPPGAAGPAPVQAPPPPGPQIMPGNMLLNSGSAS